MTISEKKWLFLNEEMKRLGIKKSDLEEKFILGQGKGGQKVNKTHSCVVLIHVPTGIEIKCQKSRNREENRFFARRLLCEKIANTILGEKTKRQLIAEKKKKQKKRRARRAKEDI